MKILRDLVGKFGSSELISKIKNVSDFDLASIAEEELVRDCFFEAAKSIDLKPMINEIWESMKYSDLFVPAIHDEKIKIINVDYDKGTIDTIIQPDIPIEYIKCDVVLKDNS